VKSEQFDEEKQISLWPSAEEEVEWQEG